MSEVSIRPMRPDELDAVADLWWHSLDFSTLWLRPEQKHTVAESLHFFRTVVAKRCDLWVAELEGRLVGLMAMYEDEIDQLYVATDEQGRGVGSALLDHAKALRPAGLRLVTLQRNQRASRFYEHHGFVVADTSGTSPAPENEPDVWYRWRPDSEI
jgi:ribosomal protein S18 acetylase RimI-like enzyme